MKTSDENELNEDFVFFELENVDCDEEWQEMSYNKYNQTILDYGKKTDEEKSEKFINELVLDIDISERLEVAVFILNSLFHRP